MKPTLLQVLEMHKGAIALPGEPLGVTHCAEHHIKLKPGSKPVYINAYKFPDTQRQLDIIKDMLDQEVIQESNSPWNSPLFLVPKKDGTLRPVIDFRRVNEVTVDNHYPLPVLLCANVFRQREGGFLKFRPPKWLLAASYGARM